MIYRIIRVALVACLLLAGAGNGFAQTKGAQLARAYMAQAKAWRTQKDSAKAMQSLSKAKQAYLSDSLFREAAEVVLNMEEYYLHFGGTDINARIVYNEQALPLFHRSPARDREEATLKTLGDLYQVNGNYPKALVYLLQAQKLEPYIKPIDKESLHDLFCAVYVMLGNLNKGLEYGLSAVKICEQIHDTTMQACAVYNRVGNAFYQMKQMHDARRYYERSLAIAKKLKDPGTEVSLYTNIGQTMIMLGKYDDCITLLKGVIEKYPHAADNDRQGVENSLFKCYIRLKRYKEAKFYADRLEVESKKISPYDNDQQIMQTLLTAYYVATKQSVPAHKHLKMLQNIGIVQHSPFVRSIVYVLAAKLDSTEHNYASAYHNYMLADKLKDSIWNEKQSRQVAQMHIQFETEKKDQELKAKEERIRLLNDQAQLQNINLRQERTTQRLITGSAILLVILLGFSYRAYRLKNRVNRQLRSQRLEIDEKNASLTLLVQQKDTLLTEKEWLMKEIHHRVKNNLQIVISLLSTQSKYLDNDIAYNAIRESQHRMRSIALIHQKLYQSDNLSLVDISSYISDLVAYLRESFDTGTRIAFEMDIAHAEFDVTRAVPLGLILNEAITNAIKYAFPDGRKGKIGISLKMLDDGSAILTIHDDGVGLPETVDINKSRSLGMSLMRGLSKQLGGSLKVESKNGMTITVDLVNEKLLKAV